MQPNKKPMLLPYILSAVIFLTIVVQGKFFLKAGDEIGFSLSNFYFMMPTVTIITGFILGFKNEPNKWIYPIIFGSLGFIIPRYLFKVWDIFAINFAFVPALLGVVVGSFVYSYKNR